MKDLELVDRMIELDKSQEEGLERDDMFYSILDYFIYKTVYLLQADELERTAYMEFIESEIMGRIEGKISCNHDLEDIFFTLMILLQAKERNKKQIIREILELYEIYNLNPEDLVRII